MHRGVLPLPDQGDPRADTTRFPSPSQYPVISRRLKASLFQHGVHESTEEDGLLANSLSIRQLGGAMGKSKPR
jgi:hypothetical protein